MIALVFAMVWSRRGQAVILALLAAFGVTAAVAAPAYLRAADRAVAAGQAATAAPAERSLEVSEVVPDTRGKKPDGAEPPPVLAETGTSLVDLPGFDYTYAADYPAVGLDPDIRTATQVVFRQDVCAHLVVVRGRCLVGEGDVVIGEQTARRLKIDVGDAVPLSYAIYIKPAFGGPNEAYWESNGRSERVMIAGTYRVPDPLDPYWGNHLYFDRDVRGLLKEPAFIGAATFALTERGVTNTAIDGHARPGAIDADSLPALRAGLTDLRASVAAFGEPVRLRTRLPDLLERIETSQAAGHLVVPVLAVALVLLACATIFLAVDYGMEGRRPELAVVALRGARWGRRWWLATGENVVSILVGALAGCLCGQLLVNIVMAVRYPGVGADPGASSLRYAPLAVLAAIVTALFAQRRHVAGRVAELLRRAPAVPRLAGAIAVQAAMTILAAVAVAQLTLTGGTLTGVGTFAAALTVLALAELTARALLPAVTWFAGRALRGGRLGAALAGFQLSRRPGATRLFALLVATVAIIGYASCAIDVGEQSRGLRAEVGTGAARAVSVQPVSQQQLLTAVRAVDPTGAFAMAVVRLPSSPSEPGAISVDSTRLASVAYLDGDGPSGATVARALRPGAAAPVTIAGQSLALDLTATGLRAAKPVSLTVVLSSSAGLGDAIVPVGALREGRHTYGRQVLVCRQGCRLKAVMFAEGDGTLDVTGRVVLHGLDQPGSADPRTLRSSAPAALTTAPEGLSIDLTPLNTQSQGLSVQPADTPYPLPAAVAGRVPGTSIKGFDGEQVPIRPVLRLPAIPGMGAPAALVDLEYADRLSTDAAPTGAAQVWLSPKAPGDVLESLAKAGLVVVTDTGADQVRRQLDRQGPALALGFYAIAALLAVALAAGALVLAAGVDRPRRVEDLSALRDQGLPRGALRQATLWTYPALITIATVCGIGIAVLAWWLTGWALPLSAVGPPDVPSPGWPRPLALVAVGLGALAVLACIAYFAGRRTLKEIP
jgi:hypothetical protein